MIYEHLSSDVDNFTFSVDRFRAPKNVSITSNKPEPGTGLWASPADCDFNWRSYIVGHAGDFNNRPIKSYFRFSLSCVTRLAVVNTLEDISRLPVHRFLENRGIDWEELARNADALLVKEAVLRENPFICWDVPSLVVFNPDVVMTE